MTVDNDAITHIYEVAQKMENVQTYFHRVVESSHHYERHEDTDFPQYRVHVEIKQKDFKEYHNDYCYPFAEIGREYGLFLFDTVTNWKDKTITLRFGYDA